LFHARPAGTRRTNNDTRSKKIAISLLPCALCAGWLGVWVAVCNYFISRACCGCILYDSAGAPAAASNLGLARQPARRLVVRVRARKTPAAEQNLMKRFNLIITQGANGCKTKEN
jgi:hypothetical protein